MRPYLIAAILFIAIISQVDAQKIAPGYNPILKETPYKLSIVQHTDDNYLVFGDINYYGNELSGSLIKVDATGKRLSQFVKVTTDRLIDKVIVLADGKILIQGDFKFLNGTLTGPIARLNADGTVDESFKAAISGKVWGMELQSDGKLVVIHATDNFNQLLRRLNLDGSVDGTFVDTYIGYQMNLAVTLGDKIYVGDNMSIRRLMPNGAADNTYNFAADATKGYSKFTVQNDGKLIVVDTKVVFSPSYVITTSLHRYNTNGTLDNTFTPGNTTTGGIMSVIVRSNGKIAIAGDFVTFDSQPGCSVELNSNGTFSHSLLIPDYNAVYSVVEDKAQSIFVTGGFRNANNVTGIRLIAKVKANYDLDRTFRVPVSRTGANSFIPIASQSTGKLIVGFGYVFIGAANDSTRLIRLNYDGSVDDTFRPQVNNANLNQNKGYISALAVQEDNKILVGGNGIFLGASPSFARLLPDGQIDNTFNVGTGAVYGTYAGAVTKILVKDSKIYVSGLFDQFNGSPCRSFVILDESGNKIGPLQNGIPLNSTVGECVLQSDGKMILSGNFNFGPSDARRFIRLNADGSLDESFVLKDVLGNPGDLEIDSHDNILLTGNYLDYNTETVIKRFKPNGENDGAFDLKGSFKGSEILTGYFVKALKDDRLAIGGYFHTYKGAKSSGVVIVDKDLARVPMDTPYDSITYALLGDYSNNILHIVGRFSNYGENYAGAAKIIFPVDQIASSCEGKALSDSTMALSWEGEFDGADRIVIEASPSDASHFSVVATVMPNAHAYELKGLNEVTPYHVRIKGVNDTYTSPYLTTVDTTDIIQQVALPPSNVTASSFTANWTNVPGTDSCVVQLSEDNFASFVSGYEGVVVHGASLSVDDLEEGSVYQYRVKRFKNKKSSAFSKAVMVNIITGIEEPGSLSVSVYPNPVADQVVVEVPSNDGGASVVIRSLSGSVVARYDMAGANAKTFDVSDLPEGIYLLVVSAQGKSKTLKLLRSSGKG